MTFICSSAGTCIKVDTIIFLRVSGHITVEGQWTQHSGGSVDTTQWRVSGHNTVEGQWTHHSGGSVDTTNLVRMLDVHTEPQLLGGGKQTTP